MTVQGQRRAENEVERQVDVFIARLPVTGRNLFGREDELGWLDACWKDRAHIASLVAFGGVGKSALVNTWLARVRDHGWHGVEKVYGWSFYNQGTEQTTSSDEFIEKALQEFGDGQPSQGSPWDRGERLAKLVRRRRAILVLDGIETLQWGPGVHAGKLKDQAMEALLKELAAQNAGLCLITTRIGLTDLEGLSGDRVRVRDLGNLSPVAGAELLRARGVHGTDEEMHTASNEYMGHGLALTLLGSYLAEVAEGDVRQRKEIGLPRENEHVRRVMTAYEKWLEAPEMALLGLVSLFDRPAQDDEIEALRAEPAIMGLTDALAGIGRRDWKKSLAKLLRVGLLSADQDKRIDAHPLVREHFAEHLRTKALTAWQEGHRRLYEHLKTKAKALPETIEEMAPLYAAVLHGCLAGQPAAVLRDVYQARIQRGKTFFHTRHIGAIGAETAMLASFFDEPWSSLRPGLDGDEQRWVLTESAFNLRASGRYDESSRLFERVIAESRACGDFRSASINAGCLIELEMARGALHQALSHVDDAIDLADRSHERYQKTVNRAHRAAILHCLGDARAERAFIEAEARQTNRKKHRSRHPYLVSMQGFRYCELLLDERRYEEVIVRASTTLNSAEENHASLFSIALDHLSLGRARFLLILGGGDGDLAQVAAHLKKAVDGLRRSGQQDELPHGLLARAALHIHTGVLALAHRDLDECLGLAVRCGFRLHEADAYLGLGSLALAEGQPGRASEYLGKARAIIEDTHYHRRNVLLTALQTQADAMQVPPVPPSTVTTIEAPRSASAPRSAQTMPPVFSFPPPLVDAFHQGKLAVLFGSGLSLGVPGAFPRWDQLPHRFLDHVHGQGIWDQSRIDAKRASFTADLALEEMLAELDVLKVALKRVRKYQAALNAVFRPANAEPGEVHRALVALELPVLVTTNFDQVLERVEGPPVREAYTWKDSDKALSDINEGRKVLFKVHGSAEDENSVVMTRREYDAAMKDASYQRIMSHLLQEYTFLLVGYGINDPFDLDLVFALNAGAFGVASRTHYVLMHRDVAAPHRDRWQRDMNIQLLPYHDHAELPAILRALGAARQDLRQCSPRDIE